MAQSRKEFIKQAGIGGIAAITGLNYTSASKLHVRIKPAKLQQGDTIGLISPASSLPEKKEYAEVAKAIRKLGFKTKTGRHAKNHYGYLAGKDKDRAADLNAMFADESVDAVIPFRGGWGCDRILELIDYPLIRQNPKALIGYSDITALLLAIYAKTGLITFHGPVGKSPFTPFTRMYFQKALMQEQLFEINNRGEPTNEPDNSITTITGGRASGILLGGNLSVLTSMMGSEYLPDWQNSILFIEDVGEDIYRIDRMLTQLKLNGVFEKINGLIFGKCTHCEVSEGFHFTLEQIVADHIKNFNIPAFVGANIGHIEDMFTLPIGIQANMDADIGRIKLLEVPVKTET